MKKFSVFPFILFVLSILIVISFNSCILNEDEQALVGLWSVDFSEAEGEEDSGINIYYDFRDDGTVTLTAFSAILESYGNPLLPTDFNYKARDRNITMTGFYGMMAMEYEIVSGPVDNEMTVILKSMDIKLVPDEVNETMEVNAAFDLIRILEYPEFSLTGRGLKEGVENE